MAVVAPMPSPPPLASMRSPQLFVGANLEARGGGESKGVTNKLLQGWRRTERQSHLLFASVHQWPQGVCTDDRNKSSKTAAAHAPHNQNCTDQQKPEKTRQGD